jgi:hypothetical protein
MNLLNHLVSVGATGNVWGPLSLQMALDIEPQLELDMYVLTYTDLALRVVENLILLCGGQENWCDIKL